MLFQKLYRRCIPTLFEPIFNMFMEIFSKVKLRALFMLTLFSCTLSNPILNAKVLTQNLRCFILICHHIFSFSLYAFLSLFILNNPVFFSSSLFAVLINISKKPKPCPTEKKTNHKIYITILFSKRFPLFRKRHGE